MILRSVISLTLILCIIADEIPTPPEILEIECKRVSAILSWSPTGNAPVTGYIIQYKTNWSPNEWLNYEFKQILREKSVALFLSPWTNYTFRVIARNNEAVSLPSGESQVCETEEDVPYKNPDLVYGRGNGPNNLVISWKPMPPIDHNAPGFYYMVHWRQNDLAQEIWHNKIIHDWQQHKLTIEQLPKLRPFRIKVEAYNSLGKAKPEATEVIGFSDEDKPTEAPKNFRVIQIRDGKSAKLTWEPVSPFSINGHFKGYKIETWAEGEENKTTEQIIPANVTTAMVNIFKPGTKNIAQVLAFNGAFDGPPSEPIEFTTPVDVYPDTPSFVWTRVTDQNNKAVIRITSEPNVTNNNPGKKLYIQYREKDSSEEWKSTVHEDIEEAKQTADLVNLEFDTFYEIRVVVKSGLLEATSNISVIDTGFNKWPKITTTTTTTTTTTVSTTEVMIDGELRGPGGDQFPNSNTNEYYVPNNNNKDKEFVNPESETTDESESFAKSPWFIALLCLLAFICAFVGIFIFMKKRRHEYEIKKNGRTPTDNIRNVSPKNTNTTEPNEFNTFITVDNNPTNRSAGQDEGDNHDSHDEEDYETRVGNKSKPVYNETTRSVNPTKSVNHT